MDADNKQSDVAVAVTDEKGEAKVENKGNGINPEWVPTNPVRPDNWDNKVTARYQQDSAPVTELQPGPRNMLDVQVNPHYCCDLLGNKDWELQGNHKALLIKGTLPPRQKAHTFELKDPNSNTSMKVKMARGFCTNEYFLEDAEGNLVAKTYEPGLCDKIKNTIIGPFLGYTVVAGVDNQNRERYVVRVCGMLGSCCPHGCTLKSCFACCTKTCDLKLPMCDVICPAVCCLPLRAQCDLCAKTGKCGCDMNLCKEQCQEGCIAQCDCLPKCIGFPCKAQCIECKLNKKCGCNCGKCVPDCKEGCLLQCEQCGAMCPSPCKTGCTVFCHKCARECKCEIGPCIADCKKDCALECEKCKMCCTTGCDKCKLGCNLCKAKCLECVELCKQCGVPCMYGFCCACNCFTKEFKEEVFLYRPWDLDCKHWVTKIVWTGRTNALGMVMPGYTMTVNFPEDSDIADRAALVALSFYCDQHLISSRMQVCPSTMPKKAEN